jgi:hypothetical protein
MSGASRERGQTLPLVALLLVFAIAAAAAIAHLAVQVVDRTRAESAADATALAGALAGRDAAAWVAVANDARLISFTRAGDVVTVEVERHGHRRAARAETVVELAGG